MKDILISTNTLRRWFAMVLLFATALRSLGDEPRWRGFWESDFPFLEATVDARRTPTLALTNNLTVRGIVLPLGDNTFACFDTDLLRWSLAWHGDFLNFASSAPISYLSPDKKNDVGQKDLNRPAGDPISATGLYPGVAGEQAVFEDPRAAGLDPGELGRGPIDPSLGRWEGIYTVEHQAVLQYSARGTRVNEFLAPAGDSTQFGYARNLLIAAHSAPLQFVVADYSILSENFSPQESTTRLILASRQTAPLQFAVRIAYGTNSCRLVLDPSGVVLCKVAASTQEQRIRIEVLKGTAMATAQASETSGPFVMPQFDKGGRPRWPETVVTQGALAADRAAYVVDRLTLPEENPWKRRVRPSSLCFYPDGRAAMVTFDGDVWQVSGIDRGLSALQWKRIASGLYEPQSIHYYRDCLYVFTRNGLERLHDLNGDGEIDYYENFANCFAQSAETRDFAMDFKIANDGGFYIAEDGQQGTFLGLNSASILKISPDGRRSEVIAGGLRGAYLGYNPRLDLLTASDQQGNWIPTSPILWIQKGHSYGFRPATKIAPPPPPVTEPLCWIPYRVAQSTVGQVWALDANLGPLNDQFLQLDYFHPRLLIAFFDSLAHPVQGAASELDAAFDFPLLKGEIDSKDGLLYLAGFRIWGSDARDWAGMGRLRYTGKPAANPIGARSASNGMLVQFQQPLDAAYSTNLANFSLQRWNYRRTSSYGSGHYLPDGAPGQEFVPIHLALLSGDRRSLFLYVPNMKPVMQMELTYRLKSQAGEPFDGHVYFTVHELQDLDLTQCGFPPVHWADWQKAPQTFQPANAPQVVSVLQGCHFYETLGCIACHSIDGTTAGRAGPTFLGLYGRERDFATGEPQIADDPYIRESILKPQARIVRGYEHSEVSMPTYEGVITDPQIQSLTWFIKSLDKPPAKN
jgi:glucose/arabinose dehydrogenase